MKLPIYLVENHIVDDLPPELTYSTYPDKQSKVIGYIVSEHRLEQTYEGTWGAKYHCPDWLDEGFYSTYGLIKCAKLEIYGLKWEDANVRE